MKRFLMKAAGSETAICVGNAQELLEKAIPSKKTFLLVDENVANLCEEMLQHNAHLLLTCSEDRKSLSVLPEIFSALIAAGVDRQWRLVACGGGLLCDIGGFVAATYMRGIEFVAMPTTLLAQVDAAIGGKNGLNFPPYKNIIGTIRQPFAVLIDQHFLDTLDDRQYRSGLAEIIKAAAIRSVDLFEFLERNMPKILQRDPACLQRIIEAAIEIKLSVVEADPFEHGLRRILNFGHSFAHAIELESALTHGEAVAIGMAMAARFSVEKNFLSASEAARLTDLLTSAQLPISTNLPVQKIISTLRADKKRVNDAIKFVFLEEIGKPKVEEISFRELENLLAR